MSSHLPSQILVLVRGKKFWGAFGALLVSMLDDSDESDLDALLAAEYMNILLGARSAGGAQLRVFVISSGAEGVAPGKDGRAPS